MNPGTVKPLADRFWLKVAKRGPDECWLWGASLNASGYGQINSGRRGAPMLASRVSWMLHRGPIPDGLCVLHRCDVRACVNPRHLFLGARNDNIQDAKAKGRVATGEQHGMARLSFAQVTKIRQLRTAGRMVGDIATQFGISRGHTSRLIHLRYRRSA